MKVFRLAIVACLVLIAAGGCVGDSGISAMPPTPAIPRSSPVPTIVSAGNEPAPFLPAATRGEPSPTITVPTPTPAMAASTRDAKSTLVPTPTVAEAPLTTPMPTIVGNGSGTATPMPIVPSDVVATTKGLERFATGVSFADSAAGEIDGNNYLFVALNKPVSAADRRPGILAYDIRDPLDPVEIWYAPAPVDANLISSIELSGSLLYVSASRSLWVLDLSDPSSPRELVTTADIQPIVTAVSGRYLYVSFFTRPFHGKIGVVDVSDPSHPVKVDGPEFSIWEGLARIEISGPLLYAVAGDGFLHIFDISAPSSLREVSSIRVIVWPPNSGTPQPTVPPGRVEIGAYLPLPPQSRFDVAAEGNNAYIAVTESGLWVIDMSNPSGPRKIGEFKNTETSILPRIFITGKLAHLVAGTWEVIDVSDPSHPVGLSSVELPVAYQAPVIAGDTLYLFVTNPPRIIAMQMPVRNR